MGKPTLIAMVGLPRSGKSTLVAPLAKLLGAPIVRRDAIRLAVHGQRYAPAAEPFIKTLDIYMVRSLFGAGHEVVICDETNYSRAARDHMRDESWDTVFHFVGTGGHVCMERAVSTGQPDLVPVIAAMEKRWEDFLTTDNILVDVTPNGVIVTRRYEGMRHNPSTNDSLVVVSE